MKSAFTLTITLLFFICLNPFFGLSQECIFEDGFETGQLGPNWSTQIGEDGIVEVSTSARGFGQFGVRMGKIRDGDFVINRLDLTLDLSAYTNEDLELIFWIRDFGDETHPEDGIFFSSNGVDFFKAYDFTPELWCGEYGALPPLDIDALARKVGLSLSSTFVIRFQQYDNADFNTIGDEDGIYLDNVKVRLAPHQYYEDFPFEDDFETGLFSPYWKWSFPDSTSLPAANVASPTGIVEVLNGVGFDSQFGVRMGRRCDGPFSGNALDLCLNLSAMNQVEMTFFIRDFTDETHLQDGLYFSDDGGENFVKVWNFKPELWCNRYGQHTPIDVDQLAMENGLQLSSTFIIRFQQYDNADFNTIGDEDGFYLDNVRVYDPEKVFADIPFMDGFESGILGKSWSWSVADATSLPAIDVTIPNTNVGVVNGLGANGSQFGLRMGRNCDASVFSTQAIDLCLNLEGKEDVALSFFIRDFSDETHIQDGLYFSDNGGKTFVKVLDFEPGLWCNQYGQFPPIDVDKLAEEHNLNLTSRFIIRFQQYDNADFNTTGDEDGFYIDDVHVYDPETIYADIPFMDDFESGELGQAWHWNFADVTALPAEDVTRPSNLVELRQGIGAGNSSFAARIGKRCDDGFATNAFDLHVNLSKTNNHQLMFDLLDFNEEDHIQDGIYFSDNGGATFIKVYSFEFSTIPNRQYVPISINLDSLVEVHALNLSDQFVIRFQQHDNADFNTIGDEDGIYLDNINVKGDIVSNTNTIDLSSAVQVYPNPTTEIVHIQLAQAKLEDTNSTLLIFNIWGQRVYPTFIQKGATSFQLNMAKLPIGTYILHFPTAKGWVIKKIIKQ